MNTKTRTTLAGTALLALTLLSACGGAAAGAPAAPTACYLRASGNNAVVEVTGVQAEAACRQWQQWSLKDAPNRALAWSDTKPELTTPSGTPVRDVVKETCRYTLGPHTYSVTDTGGMSIGTHWCQELYARAVKAG